MAGRLGVGDALDKLDATRTGVPQWVRDLVDQLHRQRNEARAEVERLKAALSGDGESSFGLGSAVAPDRVALPGDYADQVSWLGDGGFQLDLVNKGDRLEVRCSSWHGVAIRPSASNIFEVGPGRVR